MPETERASSGGRVCVVDDDPAVGPALARFLERSGWVASVFGSAEEYLASGLEESGAPLVLDVRMPGLDGPTLFRGLLARHGRFPVVFISAVDDRRVRAEMLAAGALGFLGKPVDFDVLLALLARTGAGGPGHDTRREEPPEPLLPAAGGAVSTGEGGGHERTVDDGRKRRTEMMRSNAPRRAPLALAALAGGLLLCGLAVAQSEVPVTAAAPQEDLATRIGPGADAVLGAMSDYLGGAREFSFSAEVVVEEIDETSPPIEMHRKSTWAVARPDHLRVTMTADAGSRISWYDGKRLTIWSRDVGTYGQIELAGDFDSALDELADRWEMYPPLADLVYSDVYAALSGGIEKGAYAGLHTVNGVLCHHLVFQQKSIDWQIWIDAGLQRVPRRITIRYKDLPGQPRWSADLSDWDFSPNFPSDLFSATVPKSATKIDILPVAGAE